MTESYQTFVERIGRVDRALAAVEPLARTVGVEAPTGQEWYELWQNKVLRQLDLKPLLIVAVVGGTNIGKSLLFNHLAGQLASAVSPMAARTRQPVCLAPPEAGDPHLLGRLFEPFRLQRWRSADDPLQDAPENVLFWRTGSHTPPRLLLLDVPDVDSDVAVNWQRARVIRQVADVLIAVLTQQKYNDSAVKRFFRAAVEADKPIVVVFNQCHLDYDAAYWPQWLATFCRETGARPELVYVVPHDPAAAEELRLPFHCVGPDGAEPLGRQVNLRDELALLHFDTIKIRAFRGALRRVLDGRPGLSDYVQSVRAAAAEFSAAAEALSATELVRVAWPNLPGRILAEEIRRWWDLGRGRWSQRIHGFYRTLGRGVASSVRTVWGALSGPRVESQTAFQQRERQAIVFAVERLFDQLQRLAQVGNEILRPRLKGLLAGSTRQRLLDQVQAAYQELPAVDEDYRAFLQAELDAWKQGNPRAVRVLRSLDHIAAIARPAITVSLAVSGWVVAGDIVGEAALQATGHTVGSLATEAAITGGITGSGEALVSTTGEGIRQAAARLFARLQSHYARQRATWLAQWTEENLLGELLTELRSGAETPQRPAFRELVEAVDDLRQTCP